MQDRAPRKKKRLSCEIQAGKSRFSGIVLDVSASGLFVQTNVKPRPGEALELRILLPGYDTPVSMAGLVARKKTVPSQLLTLAQGGVGVSLTEPVDAYLDFVESLSPEHAESVAKVRAERLRASGADAGDDNGESRPGRSAAVTSRRFRIHVVQTTTGKKGTYLASCASEQAASEEVLKQLGSEWQVLFIEHV